tara:strand:- start:364 stop:2793 length:2430 start_codon:yes stop_codon:yes gene_type:complete
MTAKGQVRNAYPAWRIFIFGMEVTEDVTDCTININDGESPNTCEITLASKSYEKNGDYINDDRYIVTPTDIHALYSDLSETEGIDFVNTQTEQYMAAGQFDDLAPTQRIISTVGVEAGSPPDHLRAVYLNRIKEQRMDPLKTQVLQHKVGVRSPLVQPDITPSSSKDGYNVTNKGDLEPWLKGEADRYPFQVGDCIFHSGDPIRIFWREPLYDQSIYSVGDTGDIWNHMFCGLVSDWTDSIDVNNVRQVRVRAEDPTRILRYGRTSFNPGIFDITQVKQNPDLALFSTFRQGLANLTVPEFLAFVIFGPDATNLLDVLKSAGVSGGGSVGTDARKNFTISRYGAYADKPTSKSITQGACGFFDWNRSVIFSLGGEEAETSVLKALNEDVKGISGRTVGIPKSMQAKVVQIKDLQLYQSLIDNQVRGADIVELALDNKASDAALSYVKDAQGNIVIDKVIEYIGKHPEEYPVDTGRLIMLAPATMGPGVETGFLARDISSGPERLTQWVSRLGMIHDLAEKIDFSFYATPRGDLVFEMPLYDTDPQDFGTDAQTASDLAQGVDKKQQSIVIPSVVARENMASPGSNTSSSDAPAPNTAEIVPPETYGPYAPVYTVTKKDLISYEVAFSDEGIRTQAFCRPQVITGFGKTVEGKFMLPQVANLFALIAQFGVRTEEVSAQSFIGSKDSALLYAQLKLRQANANARTLTAEILPRLGLGPNRPLLMPERFSVGTVRSLTHRLTWGESGSMTTDVEVNFIRSWSGQKDDEGRPLYEPIGGFASDPINLALRTSLHPKKNQPKSSTKEERGTDG